MRSRLRAVTAAWMAVSSASVSVKVWWARWLALRSCQTTSMSLSSGAYFGSHSTVSQVRSIGNGGERALAGVDRAIVFDQDDRLGRASGLGAVKMVKLFEMRDEIAAPLGRAGVYDEFAREVIQRAQHCDLLGLSGRGHAQVRARFRPHSGEIGMRQGFALVTVEKHNVALRRLLFAQLQAQADPLYLARYWRPFRVCRGRPPAILFFRNALDSCERLMRAPARASISARRRGIVQLGRLATGASSKGCTTRKAVSLFTGRRAGRDACFQRLDTAVGEIAAPQANRIFSHAERLRDPGAGPPRQRQQYPARPIRLPSITRVGERHKGGALLTARRNRRFSRHAIHLRIEVHSESQNPSVGQSSGICLDPEPMDAEAEAARDALEEKLSGE